MPSRQDRVARARGLRPKSPSKDSLREKFEDRSRSLWDRAVSLHDYMTRELGPPVVGIERQGIYVGWLKGSSSVIGIETFWGHSDDSTHYYAGEWHHEQIDGHGRLEHDDTVYVGEFYENAMHWRGVAVDGSSQEVHHGFFYNNKKAVVTGKKKTKTREDESIELANVTATAAALALDDALDGNAIDDAHKPILSDVRTMALAPAALANDVRPRASAKRSANAK